MARRGLTMGSWAVFIAGLVSCVALFDVIIGRSVTGVVVQVGALDLGIRRSSLEVNFIWWKK